MVRVLPLLGSHVASSVRTRLITRTVATSISASWHRIFFLIVAFNSFGQYLYAVQVSLLVAISSSWNYISGAGAAPSPSAARFCALFCKLKTSLIKKKGQFVVFKTTNWPFLITNQRVVSQIWGSLSENWWIYLLFSYWLKKYI